jgi:hypothetical protein
MRFSAKMEEADYSASKNKMNEMIDHDVKHNSPKVKRKALAAAKDLGVGMPDKLEMLKDQNLHLKRHQ